MRAALAEPRADTTHRVASGVPGEYMETFCVWPVEGPNCPVCMLSLNEWVGASAIAHADLAEPTRCLRISAIHADGLTAVAVFERALAAAPWVVPGQRIRSTREYHWFDWHGTTNPVPTCSCAQAYAWSSPRRMSDFTVYLRDVHGRRLAEQVRQHEMFVQREQANRELFRSGRYQIPSDEMQRRLGLPTPGMRSLTGALREAGAGISSMAAAMRRLRNEFAQLTREEQEQLAREVGGVLDPAHPDVQPPTPPPPPRRRERRTASGERVFLDE